MRHPRLLVIACLLAGCAVPTGPLAGEGGSPTVSPASSASPDPAFAAAMTYTLPQAFDSPYCVAVDHQGNLYVGSGGEKTVKRVSPGGQVTVLLDEPTRLPQDIAVDGAGNLYVSLVDVVGPTMDHWIVKITPEGQRSTLANTGQYGTRALVVDRQGQIYVSSSLEQVIKKVGPDGTVSVFAGSGVAGDRDGVGTAAQFKDPKGLAIDGQGNLYVADEFNSKIRKIDPSGRVTTLVSNFPNPQTLAVDRQGNLFVPFYYGNAILRVSPQGQVTWWAGDGVRCYSGPLSPDRPDPNHPGFPDPCETLIDGPRLQARFLLPRDIAVDSNGSVFVVESLRRRLRRIEPGPAPERAFAFPVPSPAAPREVEDMALAAIAVPPSALVNQPMPIKVIGVLPDGGWITHRAEAVLNEDSQVVTIKATRRRLEPLSRTEALRPEITVHFYPPAIGTYTLKARVTRDGALSREPEEVVQTFNVTGGSPPPVMPRPISPDPNSPPPSPPPSAR